jgi:hypothetical protein
MPDPQEMMPPDAIGLIHFMERTWLNPDPLQILSRLATEEGRLTLATDLAKRDLIDNLKRRYEVT